MDIILNLCKADKARKQLVKEMNKGKTKTICNRRN